MSTSPPTVISSNWLELSSCLNRAENGKRKLLTIFGTRPEVIKLAPVIRELSAFQHGLQIVNITSAQHTDLLYPFVELFGIDIAYDLQTMEPGQTPNQVCARVLSALDPILSFEEPDLIVVQGDTTTALAGALAGFHRRIPIAHVEAGLRSGCAHSPFPEEMNRRLITSLASFHFAATERNRETLLSEGVDPSTVFVTGNPVVDSLKTILSEQTAGDSVRQLLQLTGGLKRIILTTHRRESFGEAMEANLRVLRRFVEEHEDTALILPVHPNPVVACSAREILSDHARIHLIEPLGYADFIALLSCAWLIVSDSGGVQEEAPTLGKPLLILRENTERAEAIESGIARLVGESSTRLRLMLDEAYEEGSWADQVKTVRNPFGGGDSGERIAQIIATLLNVPSRLSLALD